MAVWSDVKMRQFSWQHWLSFAWAEWESCEEGIVETSNTCVKTPSSFVVKEAKHGLKTYDLMWGLFARKHLNESHVAYQLCCEVFAFNILDSVVALSVVGNCWISVFDDNRKWPCLHIRKFHLRHQNKLFPSGSGLSYLMIPFSLSTVTNPMGCTTLGWGN